MSKTQYLQRLAQSWYIRVKVRPMGDVAAALGALGRSDDHGIESRGRFASRLRNRSNRAGENPPARQ